MSAGIVIAGGGLAGQRCAETLRRAGFEGRVRIVCAELQRPYDRPPLSKQALVDAQAAEQISFRPDAWYQAQSVELLLGVSAQRLDCRGKLVQLSDGARIGYDQLLIATGARPRKPAMLARYANVTTLRTLDDSDRLRRALARGGRMAIIGAGFIGQEVAAAARRAGLETTVIDAASQPLEHVVGASLGAWFAELHRAQGANVLLGRQLSGARGNGSVESLTLGDGTQIDCDHVVVGVGVQPDLEWLAGSELDAAGVCADAAGHTGVPDVYAAGDAAATFDPFVGRHVAGGHWEAAGRGGARAARAMLGLDLAPPTPPSFWSDLYGIRIQYLGHASLADHVTVVGDPDGRDFSATFTRAGAPVAALLVGRPQQLPQARALLAAYPTTTR